MTRVVIVGATSRIAECCARLWAAEKAHLLLAGRDLARLDVIAQDLRVRGASSVEVAGFDAEQPDLAGAADAIAAQSFARLGGVDVVLIAHGWLPDQAACQHSLATARRALDLNGSSACLVAEAFAQRLEPLGAGTIAVIGSVAGDRGRQSNYVYGAAKGLVTRYCEGLRNRLHRAGVKVVLIKPGPTDTPMTAEFRARGARLAAPEAVASSIVDGVRSGRAVVYAPGLWRLIMLVIRHIPEFVFVRLKL
ncbi:SDR family oxidoreductase [Derxia lacustris]|uniref:SDR family oxidoreductase n=1 Tax=Derxia lacustris TaxID=764842 RepID=UPI000A174548|nr:SDR family oxidoreductase [Derxia lacustris]